MGNRYFVTFLFVLTVFVLIIVITIATLSVLLASQFSAMKTSSDKTGEYSSPVYAQTSDDFLIPGNPLSTQLPGSPSSLSFPSSSSSSTTASSSPPSSTINNSNTFYTKGLLSTVLTPSSSYLKNHLPDAILNQQQRQQQDNTGENQTIQTNLFYMYPKLVSGVWSLNVSVGLVTDFHANFKLITINGIDKHFVELLNFQNVNGSPVKFNQFSNTPINGFVDIKIDNEVFMTKVPVIIKLFKINTISVVIKNELVDNIFYDNDILGITDSFKNFKNDELLILEGDDEN